MGTKEHGKKAFLFENTVPMVLEFCRDRIWVSSRWNFALLSFACFRMLVCLFLPPGLSDAYAGGLVCFLRLFRVVPVAFDIFLKFFSSFSECVLVVLKVCFIAYCLVVSAGFLIFAKISLWKFFWKIFGGKEKSIYLCNRKRETNAPHDEASGSLGSKMKKEFFERFT